MKHEILDLPQTIDHIIKKRPCWKVADLYQNMTDKCFHVTFVGCQSKSITFQLMYHNTKEYIIELLDEYSDF